MLMNDEAAQSFGLPAFLFYAKVKNFFKVKFFITMINNTKNI